VWIQVQKCNRSTRYCTVYKVRKKCSWRSEILQKITQLVQLLITTVLEQQCFLVQFFRSWRWLGVASPWEVGVWLFIWFFLRRDTPPHKWFASKICCLRLKIVTKCPRCAVRTQTAFPTCRWNSERAKNVPARRGLFCSRFKFQIRRYSSLPSRGRGEFTGVFSR